MKTFLAWVATIALLLAGVNASAQDEEAEESVEESVEECPEPECPAPTDVEQTGLRLPPLPVIRPDEEGEEDEEASGPEAQLTLLELPPAPSWAGWHHALFVSARTPVLTGNASYAVPASLGFLLRWVSRDHLGLELGIEGGVWPTKGIEDETAPAMFSFPLHGVASWENWAVSLGAAYSVLQSPIKGKGPYSLGLVELSGEYHNGGFFARLRLGQPFYSQLARLSGLWVGVSIGYYR